jgi:multimeric flavodoxin WrbA
MTRWNSDGIQVEQLELRSILPIRHCTVCGKKTKKNNHKSKCKSKEAMRLNRINRVVEDWIERENDF